MFNKEHLRVNVVNDVDTKQYVHAVLDSLHSTLVSSLGPYGSTAIVHDPQVGHYMTKDGFSILNKVRYNDPILNTLLSIIRESSQRLVMRVGDGSTTSIIASNYIHGQIVKLINDNKLNIRPKDLIDLLQEAVERIIEVITTKYTKHVSEDLKEIDHIAAVSLNNDKKLGKLVGDIYRQVGFDGFVRVKLSKTKETTFETSPGFEIDAGYLDKELVNTDTDECRINNVRVLMFDGALQPEDKGVVNAAINNVNEMANSTGHAASLVIIAPGLSSEMSSYLRQVVTYNYTKKDIRNNINVIKFALGTEHDQESYQDLATKTGATIVKNSMGDRTVDILDVFGFVGEVTSSYRNTVFTDFVNDTDIVERVAMRIGTIRAERQRMKDENIIDTRKEYELQKRLAVLEGKLVTLYVGGNSDHEKATTKYLIDDAVSACKSAMRHGYVIGCNLTIPLAIKELLSSDLEDNMEIALQSIYKAFFFVFTDVYFNKHTRPVLGEEKVTQEEYDHYVATLKELDGRVESIFTACLEREEAYNIITEEFTATDIINSAETEIEILRNVISIISLVTTSNQFITANAETSL